MTDKDSTYLVESINIHSVERIRRYCKIDRHSEFDAGQAKV